MRLIDADKINPKDVVMGNSEFAKDIKKAMQDLIDSQPTAYDIDKVLEQMGDLESYNNDKHKSKPCKFTEGYGCAIDSTIEIVKAGGLDENR